MIKKEKCLVVDVDGTICPIKSAHESYADLTPYESMVEALRKYKAEGFHIILTTSRNMRTYDGNVGLINVHTAPTLIAWLERHGVPYDELHFGKPWPGRGGFYIDDKAVRPSEFLNLKYEEILNLISNE